MQASGMLAMPVLM